LAQKRRRDRRAVTAAWLEMKEATN